MSGRHIAITTWLGALGLLQYHSLFSAYGGVEDLLYASEGEIRDLGLKNGAHRAKIVSSLRILREKYERGKSPVLPANGTLSLQQPCSATSSTCPTTPVDLASPLTSPDKLDHNLQRELNSDPSELKSWAWYHGGISRQRAESLVPNSGDFLVRDSVSKPGDFVLTCGWRGVALHFIINTAVGACPPGSLPSITFQFEDESFSSVQELIQFYQSRRKAVMLASGAVLIHPVGRHLPLSYYDSKYGSLQNGDSGGYCTPNPSPRPSPFSTPPHTPTLSPSLDRRGVRWAGSQPVLSMEDKDLDRSRSPSLERFGSLPVINVVPPGGPDHVRCAQQRPQNVTSTPLGYHHRAGSEPMLMGDVKGSAPVLACSEDLTPTGSQNDLAQPFPSSSPFPATTPDSEFTRPFPSSSSFPPTAPGWKDSPSPLPSSNSVHETSSRWENSVDHPSSPPPHPASLTSTQSESSLPRPPHSSQCRSLPSTKSESGLTRPPPPKPCRVPSIKYKHRPKVQIRNQHLYEDDGRDYTDVHQLSGPPSWAVDSRQSLDSGCSPSGQAVSKSRSFQGSRTKEAVDNHLNSLHKGYQTLPHKMKSYRLPQPCLPSNTTAISPTESSFSERNYHIRKNDSHGNGFRKTIFTLPDSRPASGISVESFQSCIFPSSDNRILDSSVLLHTKSLLLSSNAHSLASHMTKLDLDLWRVTGEDDLGLGITSGIELCILPQGEQLREDILERSECQRLWVMTSLLTCTSVKDRARMLSQWIQVARELHITMGNLFAFAALMEALTSPQIKRLRDTWLILRQHHTPSAFLFDTRLKPLLHSLRHHGNAPPFSPHPVTLPYLTPVVRVLQDNVREEEYSPHNYHHHHHHYHLPVFNSWQSADLVQNLEVVLNHLHNARSLVCQAADFGSSARHVLAEVRDALKTDAAEQKESIVEGQANVKNFPEEKTQETSETKEQEKTEEVKENGIAEENEEFEDLKENQLNCSEETDKAKRFDENVENIPEVQKKINWIKTFSQEQKKIEELQESRESYPEVRNNAENFNKETQSYSEVRNNDKFSKEKQNCSESQEKSRDLRKNQENCSHLQKSSGISRDKPNHCSLQQENQGVEEKQKGAELAELFRTEFHLRLMWGPEGVGMDRAQRVAKFQQLLTVLSERLEPPGNNGTEV